MAEGQVRPSLLCMAGSSFCALPLEHVVETTRPLPIKALAGAPDFVAGFSVVRGVPIPVIVVQKLLGGGADPVQRLVTVRAGDHQIGLGFSSVIGVRSLGAEIFSGLPPLLDRQSSAVTRIGALDNSLVLLLDAARMVPADVFAMLDALELAS